ncbi:hypothetical protein QO179_23655 [Bacillus stercoris]|nr:hypothetical protein [Bacillus stercoris]
MTAAGAYYIMQPTASAQSFNKDCDYDDMLEGDDDCEAVEVSKDELTEVEEPKKSEWRSLILFLVTFVALGFMIGSICYLMFKRGRY